MTQEFSDNIDINVIDQIFGKEEEKQEEKQEESPALELESESTPAPASDKASEPEKTEPQEENNVSQEKKETPVSNKVDYGALKQERARRKELEAQLKDFQEKLSKYELQEKGAVLPQASIDENGDITFDKNPQEALRQASIMMYQELSTLKKAWEEKQEQEKANQQVAQLVNEYRTTAVDYVKSNPDYKDAYNHIYKIKTAEYELMGMTPKEADAAFVRWEMQVGYDAYQNEFNPHEVLHELARRVGYSPAANNVVDSNENGSVNSKIALIKQGLQDNKNLTPSKALTPEKEGGNLIEDFLPSNRRKRG